jgi:hypothetical protein
MEPPVALSEKDLLALFAVINDHCGEDRAAAVDAGAPEGPGAQ